MCRNRRAWATRRAADSAREVGRSDVAADLVDHVDVVASEQAGVLADHVFVRRLVDAEGLDVALGVGHDVADIPGDLRQPLNDDALRIGTDEVHLLLVQSPEVSLNQESWHAPARLLASRARSTERARKSARQRSRP